MAKFQEASRQDVGPFIGRSEIVAAVQRERVAIVCAEPGAGKTRLLSELRALAPETIAVTVRCHRGTVSTYEPLEALIETAGRQIAGEASDPIARAALEDGDRIAALLERFVSIADTAPMLVQIDDLQWAPPDTLAAIALCIDRLRDSPIRWHIAMRPIPESPDAFAALRCDADCRSVDLPLLDAKQTAELARSLGDESGDDLYRLTGGNPLYIQEWLIARERPGDASTLQATLELRLGDLPPRGNDLAALVALAERPLTIAEISSALEQPPETMRAIVDELVALGILRREDDRVDFVHDLVRGARVRTLEETQRNALWNRLVSIARNDVERARFLAAANRPDEAEAAYLTAARAALERYAFAEAREIGRRLRTVRQPSRSAQWQLAAIASIVSSSRQEPPSDRAKLEEFLANRTCVDSATSAFYLELLLSVGDAPQDGLGLLIITTMIEAADIDAVDKGAFYCARAKYHYGIGDFATGLAGVDEALTAGPLQPRHTFELRCLRALFRGTDAVDAARAELIALADAAAHEALPSFAFVYLALAVLEDSLDDHEAVVRWATRGLACNARLANPFYFYLAWAHVRLGNLAAALDIAEAANGVRSLGGASRTISMFAVQIEALAWSGAFARARTMLENEGVDPENMRILFVRGLLAEREGRLETAVAFYAQVADRVAGKPFVYGALALVGLVRVSALLGEHGAAERAYRQLVSGSSQTEFSFRERVESDFYLALALGNEAVVRGFLAKLDEAKVPILARAVAFMHFGKLFNDRNAISAATAAFERCGATSLAKQTRQIAQSFGFDLDEAPATRGVLTEREAEIARLIAAGRTNREIAVVLQVSSEEVTAEIGAMIERYGLRSRGEIGPNVTRVG
jgi:DNA-binding CsgD family transcriptional regulator